MQNRAAGILAPAAVSQRTNGDRLDPPRRRSGREPSERMRHVAGRVALGV